MTLKRSYAALLRGGQLDLSRLVWAVVVAVYLGQSLWSQWNGQAWDWVSFGTGAGAVLAGGGLGAMFHSKSEPMNV